MWWWSELEGDNLSLEDKICMKKLIISALVTNIHLTAIYHGNGNKNTKFILSGKRWNFIKLSWTEEWLLSFFITLKSPLIRKRPRNSELRNKLKFNKDNYRLRLVFKLISISNSCQFSNYRILKTIESGDIELENGEPDYFFKKEVECQTTLCASVRWVFKLMFQTASQWSLRWLARLAISINSKNFQSQGDYLELAARVKELEHKMEPRWDFIKTFIIGLS